MIIKVKIQTYNGKPRHALWEKEINPFEINANMNPESKIRIMA